MQKNLLIITLLALCCGHSAHGALTPIQAAATAHARAAHDKHEDIDPAIAAMIHDVIEQITIPKSIADYAEEGNWEKVMELSIQPGIDLNSKDEKDGETALMLAVCDERLDVIIHLTNIKDASGNLVIDLNARNDDGENALSYAVASGNLGIITCLTSIKDDTDNLKMDLNAAYSDGSSVLMQAVKCGNLEVVRHLTQIKDASGKRVIVLNAQDEDGDTALTLAQEQDASSEMVAYLESLGCIGRQGRASVPDGCAGCCCMD